MITLADLMRAKAELDKHPQPDVYEVDVSHLTYEERVAFRLYLDDLNEMGHLPNRTCPPHHPL
jgi:hypothetical protein